MEKMELLKEFGTYNLFGNKYPRRILASRQALKLLKRLAINRAKLLDDIQKMMEKYDFHTCIVTRTYGSITVHFTRYMK